MEYRFQAWSSGQWSPWFSIEDGMYITFDSAVTVQFRVKPE